MFGFLRRRRSPEAGRDNESGRSRLAPEELDLVKRALIGFEMVGPHGPDGLPNWDETSDRLEQAFQLLNCAVAATADAQRFRDAYRNKQAPAGTDPALWRLLRGLFGEAGGFWTNERIVLLAQAAGKVRVKRGPSVAFLGDAAISRPQRKPAPSFLRRLLG